MEVRFIAQPQDNLQLGTLLKDSLSNPKTIQAVTIVSAFASRATITRMKSSLIELHKAKAKVRLVVGVDMGGTSREVLEEIASWPIEVFIFKNRRNGVTFHPKIYLIEKKESAEIYIGSNNLTEGGFFKNYESTALVSYKLPKDLKDYESAKAELAKFLDPQPPIAKHLDEKFLNQLLLRNDIPSDAEARTRAKAARLSSNQSDDDIFGFEVTPGAKALPLEYQDIVLAAVNQQLTEVKKANREAAKKNNIDEKSDSLTEKISLPDVEPMAYVPATAFYMELNATKGAKALEGGKKNIPGEQRIPLPAIWSAQDFWGWKANYKKEVNPRKKKKLTAEKSVDRIYYNWYAQWEISQIGDKARHIHQKKVRMYFYANSSDFRFTCGEIAKWGDPGDIVRLERVDNGIVDFKCVLAKKGTKEHEEWSIICTSSEKTHTKRGFGFS
ncbi:phospholipase D family protein [Pseudomonas tohonis]|uniref:phospholipase D family protein n=1 Tax=Pseudomonas tohonis TaxID=2725477 RepID=UPI00255B966C|nr:phospholipase D family protein [Pseudomonas tohonis]